MKVLFAVSNENISTQIVKKYQKEYKEIISYKNMYYFNAIVKELQRDKSYDRIVISEDLEPFANNNSDAIDKFLFEKLDNISDEATGINGEDIPIILLSTDRRTKSEPVLVKLFGIGIYNALLGQDRSTSNVCALLNKPRSKKEAKIYYKIESDEVNYKSESEESVSEAEIQNIRNHYSRLGKDEDRYIESFNNIASQYNDAQLRIITKFLPLNVKAVLEEKSPKYQSVMTFGDTSSTLNTMKKNKEEEGLKIGFLNNSNSNNRPSKPVIVPTAVKKVATKKSINNKEDITRPKTQEIQTNKIQEDTLSRVKEIENLKNKNDVTEFEEIVNLEESKKNSNIEPVLEEIKEPVKRGRGRPKKVINDEEKINAEEIKEPVKRGRGRPKKVVQEDTILPVFEEMKEKNNSVLPGFNDIDDEDEILPGFGDEEKNNASVLPGFDDIDDEDEILPGFGDEEKNNASVLPGFDDIDDKDEILPGFGDEEKNNASVLPGFDDIDDEDDVLLSGSVKKQKNNESVLPGFDEIEDEDDILPGFDNISQKTNREQSSIKYTPMGDFNAEENNRYVANYNSNKTYSSEKSSLGLLSRDRKIVSFVGTTKNGTSFLVNNLAKCLSSMGIKTAILDLTTNRNSYYIYTKNEENLRNIAFESIKKLRSGITNGISVGRYLDVYTALPGDKLPLEDVDGIITTLLQNYSVILMDCDFNTPAEYFGVAQEIYVIQTMDILTIQPMTAFLRDLKAKDILNPEKIRIVINKEIKVRGLTSKAIIGGLAFYNDPAMSFMTELFDKDKVNYCIIPFEEEIYSKYLEGVMDCEISLNGYSKNFNTKLKELANMVYPLLGNKYKPMGDYSKSNYKFSSDMNNTLEQMRNKY